MKLISIGDGRGKNAMVGIAPYYRKIEKEEKSTAISHRIIKTSLKTNISALEEEAEGDDDMLFQNLIKSDPEIDLKEEGRFTGKLHYTYADEKNELVSNVRFQEQIFYSDGKLRKQRTFNTTEANIQNETLPIRWTGVTIPVYEAMRRYIFTHTYQLFHTNGLTYSFLFDLAKQLHEKKRNDVYWRRRRRFRSHCADEGGQKIPWLYERCYCLQQHFLSSLNSSDRY